MYPQTEPYEHGLLDVGDGNHIHWEACGNPDGKPALVVHGGPGSGCSPRHRRYFDPQRYRAILFDQRGCGRSTPHASDPATDMSVNTTEHLIADMEKLREHLGVERWLLYGGSWGSTLILAYAERYPHRVSEIVIASVTVSRREDTDWLYYGVRRFFPEAWDRFRDALPEADRDGDLIAAYARLMNHPDVEVRSKAAADWCAWEDAVISQESSGNPGAYSSHVGDERLALVRITSHYFAHNVWLDEGILLREAGKLAGIPGVLIHGRLDMGGPPNVPWELAKVWLDAELTIVDSSGHTGNEEMREHILAAMDRFAG